MENEVWKDIPRYEGFYQVSSLGNVKSIWYTQERILKYWIKKRYYHWVTLCKDRKHRQFVTSRLVAAAFLWLDLNNPSIIACHRDDNPSNNNLDNIFIWTQSDNIRDMHNKWKYKWWVPRRIVNQYTLEWDLIKEWISSDIPNKCFWTHRSNILHCCRWTYRFKTAGWYIWKFA